MVLALLGGTLIVFVLSRLTGDPRQLYFRPGGYGMPQEQYEALGKKLGLDKPLVVQYFMWLGGLFRGDLGRTMLDDRRIVEILPSKLGATLQLSLGALIYALVVGITGGVIAAVKRGTLVDYIVRGYAFFGSSVPSFWVGLMAIVIFAQTLGWLPAGTWGDTQGFPLAWSRIRHFILPVMITGWTVAAGWTRLTRSAMLEVLDSEYIKFARAKGVRSWAVIWKHAFRNATITPLTAVAVQLASFVSGLVVIETVFSWPGIGKWSVTAIENNDFAVVSICVLIFSGIFVVSNFFADIAYAYLDPRIRYT